MKKNLRSRYASALVLSLSVVLMVTGVLMSIRTCKTYESILVQCTHYDRLAQPLQHLALSLAFYLGLTVLGSTMILLTLVKMAGRNHREIALLQQKNQAMDELNRKQQQLAHHQRLELLGTLTSSISHEFNNLLTPIMGYSMMALEKLPPEETELYDDILEIYTASKKAKTIISRLSDLSRKNSSSTFHQVSPDTLIQKTLDVVAPARPKNCEIKLGLNCWDQRILANEIQISQLLLNLIINSFHAMEGIDGVLSIDTWFDQESIHIRLTDNGKGIDPDALPHIFEPFFTTKEAGKGTGLGLAIVAQVIEDHHGNIRVCSTPGNGTSFTVTLPRLSGQKADETAL